MPFVVDGDGLPASVPGLGVVLGVVLLVLRISPAILSPRALSLASAANSRSRMGLDAVLRSTLPISSSTVTKARSPPGILHCNGNLVLPSGINVAAIAKLIALSAAAAALAIEVSALAILLRYFAPATSVPPSRRINPKPQITVTRAKPR